MAEKINIASFELENLDSLIQSTVDLKANIDALKESNKQLAKNGDAASESFIKNTADLKSLNTAYNANIKVLAEANQKTADLAVREQLLTAALNSEVKTINQARESNKLLNKLRNETNVTTEKGRAELKQLNDALDSNNKFIKENVDAYTQQKIGIGGYEEAIKNALGSTTLFGQAQRTLNQILSVGKPIYTAIKTEILGISTSFKAATASTEGMSAAQKAAAISTNLVSGALKILKVALIATGIGAILVLIGSLISYFSKTQRGADFVSKALAALGAIVDVLIDRMSQFGEALIKFFSGDFTGGFNDMKKSLEGVGDEMIREAGLAYELEAALIAVQEKEIGLITVQAQRKKQIEELRFAAKDEQKELKERARLLQEAGDIEKNILADKIEIAKEEARISEAKLNLGESSREDIKATEELKAKVIELETESLKLQRSIEAEKQGLLKRARSEEESAFKARQAESKKIIDAAIKESKTKLQLFIAENDDLGRDVGEKVAIQEQIRDKRLAVLKEEIAAGKKTVTEAALDEYNIKKDFLDAQSELVLDFADQELQAYVLANQSKIENNQLLTDALVQQEVERLDALLEQQRIFEEKRLAQGEISQLQYNQAIDAIESENRFAKQDLQLQLEEERKAKEAIDIENQRAIDQANLDLDYELTRKYIELDRKAELENAKKTGADTNLINKKYDQLQIEQKRQVGQNKLDIASGVFGGLVDLLGKESAAGKAAAVAQAVINVAQGVTKAIADGGLLGIVTGALVAATGAVSIGKILSTPKPDLPSKSTAPKLAEGGRLLQGPRHSQGGIPIEAEGGEWILNRKASAMFNPILSMMNEYGKGNKGYNSTGFFADGGQVGRGISSGKGLDPNIISEAVIDAIGSIPVVNVAQNTYDKVYESARIVQNASI